MDYKRYTLIFNRYLPVIKILLKKSLTGEQVLSLDKGDFEKVGARKSGFKFKIEFVKGRVNNIISGSDIASELAIALQENEGVRNVLLTNDFTVELNSRFQLKFNCLNPIVASKEEEAVIPNETDAVSDSEIESAELPPSDAEQQSA